MSSSEDCLAVSLVPTLFEMKSQMSKSEDCFAGSHVPCLLVAPHCSWCVWWLPTSGAKTLSNVDKDYQRNGWCAWDSGQCDCLMKRWRNTQSLLASFFLFSPISSQSFCRMTSSVHDGLSYSTSCWHPRLHHRRLSANGISLHQSTRLCPNWTASPWQGHKDMLQPLRHDEPDWHDTPERDEFLTELSYFPVKVARRESGKVALSRRESLNLKNPYSAGVFPLSRWESCTFPRGKLSGKVTENEFQNPRKSQSFKALNSRMLSTVHCTCWGKPFMSFRLL